MAFNGANSIRFEATFTGTDAIGTGGSALRTFQQMPASLDGQVVSVRWAHTDPAIDEWENIRGVYDHTAQTISRVDGALDSADPLSLGIADNSDGTTTRVSASAGTKHVEIVALAEDLQDHTHGTTGIDAGTVVRPATPGAWNPAAIDLSQSADYQPYTLSGNVVLELAGTPVIGAYNEVRITGDGAFTVQPGTNIRWSQGTPQDARVVPSGDQMLVIRYVGDWDGAPKAVVAIAAAGGSGGHTIQDEGTPLTQRANLNFTGGGVTASDDSGNDATVINIPTGTATTLDTQIVNAKDHGATGDGTTDDTAAINAAIAAVNALTGQRMIWLPPASGGAYRITSALDPVDPGVYWCNETRVKFEGTAGNFKVLQLGSETAETARVRHRIEVVGNDVDTAGFTLVHIPNHIFSDIEIVRAEGGTIGADIRAFNGNAVWGNRIRPGDIRQSTVCLKIGADGTNSWMNSNSIVGGALQGDAGAVGETIGIEFSNTNGAISGEDNNVYDTSLQGLDVGVRSNVPTGVLIQSGRFESLTVPYEYSGASASPGDGPIVRPSFIWSVGNPLVQRTGGTDPYVSLPLSRTGRPLHWGGHPFEDFRLVLSRPSAAQTLSTANYYSGHRVHHTGGAVTYTVPSRIQDNQNAAEELVVSNRGSGAITWSASGVTLLGDTDPLPAGETATLCWDYDGTTERVEIRATS